MMRAPLEHRLRERMGALRFISLNLKVTQLQTGLPLLGKNIATQPSGR
jgi:hypothetical protein